MCLWLFKYITDFADLIHCSVNMYTGYTQKNGAGSKVNKKSTSHRTRAQRTPSAAATLQVSHALPAVRFSCLLRGGGTCCKRRQPPSHLATPFAGSNTMRFLSLGFVNSGVPGGVWSVQPPTPEIPKALQNRAKLNPTVKTVKNC